MIDIWKLEEKQSDVAFALNAFSDAIRNEVDQVIAVTNDSDFAPAMRMIRQHTRAVVGLIAPARYQRGKANSELEKHAHWTRTHILDQELAQSHLPALIRLKNKVVYKPWSWYPRPDLLIPIYCVGYIHRSFISKRVLVESSYWKPPNSHTLPLASFHLKGTERAPSTFVAAATP
jgi:hypothetical protein